MPAPAPHSPVLGGNAAVCSRSQVSPSVQPPPSALPGHLGLLSPGRTPGQPACRPQGARACRATSAPARLGLLLHNPVAAGVRAAALLGAEIVVQGFGPAHPGVNHPTVSALFRTGEGKGSGREQQRNSPCPGAVLGLPQTHGAKALAGCGKGQRGQSHYRRWLCTNISLQRKHVWPDTSCTTDCRATAQDWTQAWPIAARAACPSPTPPGTPVSAGLEQSGTQAPRRVPRHGASRSLPL